MSEDITFAAGLLALTLGCWLLSPALGLIVPGGLVCGALAWKRTRRRP